MEYFQKKLPSKRQKICQVYDKILLNLKNIQSQMLRSKYLKSKELLSETFILLVDNKELIDESILKEIKAFQKILFSNVKSGLLGLSGCSNLQLVKSQLSKVISILEDRTNELKEYLSEFSV